MNKATIIEMVLFRTIEGVTLEDAKTELKKCNDFLAKQKGFVSRKITVSEDGEFLDLVYWTDMDSAKAAGAKSCQDPDLMKIFSVIDEKTQVYKHFTIFE
jgi:hypothetical protein